MPDVVLQIQMKSSGDMSKSRVELNEGIPGELQPRTVPVRKKPNDPMIDTSNWAYQLKFVMSTI